MRAGDKVYKNRIVVGFIEKVTLHGEKDKEVLARVDSGATKSSIDKTLAEELGLGPVVGERVVRNAHGRVVRKAIKARIKLGDEEFTEEFTLANRSRMNYPVLIGHNILDKGFLIDPEKEVHE